MKIYLMRHGETEWNREGRLQGQRDIPMNRNGIMQMERLGERLKEQSFCVDQIIASPLARAGQSAEIVAEKIGFSGKILTDEAFIERSFGKAEGVIWSPGLDLTEERYQAESAEALCRRAEEGICKYLDGGAQSVLLVAHGAILKAVITVLSKQPIVYEKTHIPITQGNIIWGETDAEGKVVKFEQLFAEADPAGQDGGCRFRSGGGLL